MITYGPRAFDSFIGKFQIQAVTLLRGVVIISCFAGGEDWSRYFVRHFVKKKKTYDLVYELYYQKIASYLLTLFFLAKAELFKNQGNDGFRKRDFRKAILLYTKGINVDVKDEELKAKLHSNRATAHFNLGITFGDFHSWSY